MQRISGGLDGYLAALVTFFKVLQVDFIEKMCAADPQLPPQPAYLVTRVADIEQWEWVAEYCPQQDNGKDCGLFAIKTLESLVLRRCVVSSMHDVHVCLLNLCNELQSCIMHVPHFAVRLHVACVFQLTNHQLPHACVVLAGT
jgi:hypothetical protein